MLSDLDFAFLAVVMALLMQWVMGCHQIIYRPPIETARRAQEVEKDKAETNVLNAHAEIAQTYALCLSARFAKNIPTLAEANKECGNLPVSPVTVTIEHSRRIGDVSQFQVMPPVPFLGLVGSIAGDAN